MFCRSSNFCRRTSLILDPKILQTCFFDWSTESDESYCMLLISWNGWNCIYLEIMKMGVGTSTSVLLAAMPFSLRQSHWSDWSKQPIMLGSSYFHQFIFELSTKSRNGCSIYTVGRKNSFGIIFASRFCCCLSAATIFKRRVFSQFSWWSTRLAPPLDRHDISKIKAIVNVSAHAEEVGRRWYCIVGCHKATCAWRWIRSMWDYLATILRAYVASFICFMIYNGCVC